MEVAEEDSFNDISTLYTGSVTLSVASPSGVPLNGTVTVPVQNGVSTFTNISIPQAGNNYTLSAVDSNNSSLTATSTSFNVVAPMTIYVDQNAGTISPGSIIAHASAATVGPDIEPAGVSDSDRKIVGFRVPGSAGCTRPGAAISGDIIDIAAGDYSPGSGVTSTYTLAAGVTIQGGFLTGGSPIPTPPAHVTTLDGMGNSYHVVTADGTNASAVLEGFTITGGNATGTGDADSGFGGGLVADGGTPTIADCIFTTNTAVSGGAIFIANDGSAPLNITNCTFQNNTATNAAGAMYIVSSSPTLLNCQFLGNSAQLGGAIEDQDGSSPMMANCLFANNSANQSAGAIYNLQCILTDYYKLHVSFE